MVRQLNVYEILVEDLFKEAKGKQVCPHIRKDEQGAYCSANLVAEAQIPEQNRLVCDHFSLQLWCLHPEDYVRCINYREEQGKN